MKQTELEKQILELLERNLAFDKDMTFGSSKPCLSELIKLAKEIASLKMEGMYEREFIEWIGENEFYRNKGKKGKWIFQSEPYIVWKTTDELYEYRQNNVKNK